VRPYGHRVIEDNTIGPMHREMQAGLGWKRVLDCRNHELILPSVGAFRHPQTAGVRRGAPRLLGRVPLELTPHRLHPERLRGRIPSVVVTIP